MKGGSGQLGFDGADDALEPCPLCGGRTRVEPHRALVWVCGACGAPRVPGAPVEEGAPEGRIRGSLAGVLGRARLERVTATAWRAGAVVIGLSAAMALGLAALIALAAGHLAALVLAGLAAVLILFALIAVRRARARDERMRVALDRAWEMTAERLLVGRDGGMSAGALARTMRTTEVHAERILVSLSARGRARVDVGEDAELRYRVDEGASRDPEAGAEGTGSASRTARDA